MPRWIFVLSLVLSAAVAGAQDPLLFPVKGDHHDGLPKARAEIYSKGLRALKEESLQPLSKDKQAEFYRLTIISGWGGAYEVVKLVKKDGEYAITRLQGDTPKKEVPGKLLKSQTAKLEAKEEDDFAKVFTASSFFKCPSSNDYWGDDGAVYVLEAVKDGQYHVAMRWSPEGDDSSKGYSAVCEWLWEHAPKLETSGESVSKPAAELSEEEKALAEPGPAWPPESLTEMGEALLSPMAKDSAAEVYRLVIRASSRAQEAVTLAKKGDQWTITHRVGNGGIQSYPPTRRPPVTGEIATEKADEFRKLFDSSAVSKMPTLPEQPSRTDGVECILEAVRDGNYHAVTRWSPATNTDERGLSPFLKCCRWLTDHVSDKEEPKK